MSRPQLIILSAPSGAGKTTLCRMLLDSNPQLKLSISTTTRPPRGSEQNGIEYFFVTQAEFEKQIQLNAFAEWAKVHENYYGTSRKFIQDCFDQNVSVILDIDVQGAESLRQSYSEQAYSVFISPPDIATLEKRLRARGTDTESVIQKRMQNAISEMKESSKFHLTIINRDLSNAFLELSQAILKRTGGHLG